MAEADLAQLGNDSEGDEDIEMTAAEVLERLEKAWLNEKFSPELLDCHTDLVDCMLDQLSAIENSLLLAGKGDLKISLHRMEIDRIRFVISSYLRLRLEKIEKYTSHVLEREDKKKENEEPLMSDSERQFAKKFLDCKKNHFNILSLKHMPVNMQSAEKEMAGVQPNLDSYVFLRANDKAENVVVEEETTATSEEILDLEKGDQHILRYKPMAALVQSGVVSLI